MENTKGADAARRAALDRVDRDSLRIKLAFFGAAAVEAGFLAAFLLLSDLSNRLHVLLLLATVAIYTIVVLGLAALGAHVSRCARLVLRAIEAKE